MNSHIRYMLTVITAVFVIQGCGSSGKQQEAAQSDAQHVEYTFEANKNYQAVYRHLLEQARACTQPQFTAKMVVNGELYQDIKAADISVVLMGLFSNNHYLKIRVDSIDKERSKIQVSNKLPRWNGLARAIRSWIMDGSTACAVEE